MSDDLELLYANRFASEDRAWKEIVWGILTRRVFAHWVPAGSTLVDLGAGYCEFVNHVVARRRIAVDLNPETARVAVAGVEVKAVSADNLDFLADGEVDVVFSSNFLEHLPSKDAVSRVLNEVRRVLKPGGRVILMGPNIRYLANQYWDYFDHHVPLSHASICEVLRLNGFDVDHVERKFLPYTVKGSRLRWPWLVELYLAARPVSSALLGKQFLVSALKT
jgi:dolichol-phosphate mannosyltransferase